jgi:PPOX class probable F420-dependent enzyme
MDADKARAFAQDNHRAVLATRRDDGGLQMTPVVAGVDGEGKVLISTRETAMKTRNLRRDPRAAICVFQDPFFGSHVQIEGTADVVSLPEAMDGLIDYYRRVSGEHDDWDDYRAAMEREKRCLIRITIGRAGPDRAG